MALFVPLDEALHDRVTFAPGATLLADYAKPRGVEGAVHSVFNCADADVPLLPYGASATTR